jgi:hypothetical protein
MQLSEENITYMFIVIAMFYTSFIFSSTIINGLKSIIEFTRRFLNMDVGDPTKDVAILKTEEIKTQKDAFLFLLKESGYLIICVIISILVVYVLAFYYLLAITEIDFADNFKQTLLFLNNFLWKDGKLLPLYLPFIISFLVVLIVTSMYIGTNKEFVEDMTFNDDKKTKLESLSKHFVLFIIIIAIFLHTFYFIHYYDEKKIDVFVMYFAILITIQLSAIYSYKGGKLFFAFYFVILLCFAIHHYTTIKKP